MTAPTSVFRPRTVSEVADAGVQLVRRHIGPFLLLSTIVSIPTLFLSIFTARLMPDPATMQPGTDPMAAFGSFGKLMLLNLVGTAWGVVGYGSLVGMADDAYHARPIEPGASLRRALGRAGSLIFGNFLAYLYAFGIFILIGIAAAVLVPKMAAGGGDGASGMGIVFALVAIPAALFGFFWIFYAMGRYLINVTPAVMTEGLGPLAAVRRSGALAQGSVKRVLGLLFLLAIVGIFVYITMMMLVSAMAGNRPQLSAALTTAALIPIVPFAAAMVTVLYYDLRIRKEGYDVELMAAQLAQSAAQDYQR